MNFYEVVAKRRTVRDFSSQPIDEVILRRILEAGLKAPSNNHLRQWEFILVKDSKVRQQLIEANNLTTDVDMKELKELFRDLHPVARDMYLEAVPKQKRMLLEAPELLVVCYKQKTPIQDCHRVYDLNGFASVWCCIENILLAMAAEGLYGVTYIPEDTPPVKAVLQLPEEYEITALIPMGYPAEGIKIVKQKETSLDEKLHIDGWGKK